MNVIAIHVNDDAEHSIDVSVDIKNKKSLILSFKRCIDIPLINDCVFLSLYIQAMQEGTDLHFPKNHPISKTLVENLAKFQTIFSRWFSHELTPINVDVATTQYDYRAKGAVSLFSGGVDSFYTYLKNQQAISHILLCIGLDIQLEETDKIKQALNSYQAFANDSNKQLLVVYTNIRHVFPHGNRTIQHAAILSALVLAYGFESLFIPASHNIDELFPWGSHPMTDPLLTNGITEIVHHGNVPRSEKTQFITGFPKIIKYLRVCNSSDEFNCGQCEKCLRSIFVFKVLNRHAVCFPDGSGQDNDFKKIKIYKESQRTFWQDNYNFAIKNNNQKLAVYAKNILFKYQVKVWLKTGLNLVKSLFK